MIRYSFDDQITTTTTRGVMALPETLELSRLEEDAQHHPQSNLEFM